MCIFFKSDFKKINSLQPKNCKELRELKDFAIIHAAHYFLHSTIKQIKCLKYNEFLIDSLKKINIQIINFYCETIEKTILLFKCEYFLQP